LRKSFRNTGTDLKYDPDYQGDYEQKKARTDHVLNIEKFNELIELNSLNGILAKIKKESDKDLKKLKVLLVLLKLNKIPVHPMLELMVHESWN
jgi:hypothetical protein